MACFTHVCVSAHSFLPKVACNKKTFGAALYKNVTKALYAIPASIVPPSACHQFLRGHALKFLESDVLDMVSSAFKEWSLSNAKV